MRALLPPSDDVDLERAYAYPSDRPWLRANMVASLDGAIAVDGRAEGLSCPADVRVLALLRDLCDGLVVGAGTVRVEGYHAVRRPEERMARRRARGQSDVPALVVVSRALDLDPASPLFVGARTRTVIVTSEAAAAASGERFSPVADVVVTPGRSVDLAAAVSQLHERGMTRLLCEGGPMLLGTVVAAGCLDELCLTVSPRLVGGDERRVLNGPVLTPPSELRLAQVLEEDGFLFTRYLRDGAPTTPTR